MTMLEVKEINTFYDMSHILFNVSLNVNEGEVVALLGRNGAGKSTTFRSVIGLSRPSSGEILFRGENLIGKPTYVIANKGIGYVPEEKRIFKEMTVLENLEIGKKGGRQKRTAWEIGKIYELFPILSKYREHIAGKLSGGEQQMLTIARTLMGNPELLLLDEPTTGLSPLVVKSLKENIIALAKSGISILLAEQNVKFALELSNRTYILDKGEIQYEAFAEELRRDEITMRKYLTV
jgi:branched-chain amino acid transport system ATP-binding protein